MVLLDWTRMGRSYCLAGAAREAGRWRVVRPLPAKLREAPVRNAGWSPFLLDGHSRWEEFELVLPKPATPEPPHLEDLWVRALRSRGRLAPTECRREILARTADEAGAEPFGAALSLTPASACLAPGTGVRSLATVVVPSAGVRFAASRRAGAPEPDVRVTLPLPWLADRSLPVKDHHLLRRAEAAGDLPAQLRWLEQAVAGMGERLAVRLGLSRAFQASHGDRTGCCWLMADGFFSLDDPQP